MQMKLGKFLAVGFLMLILAGCSKSPESNIMTQDDFERNKQIQDTSKSEQRR